MTCDDVIRSEIVEKYLHDELGENSRDDFEQHYFECDRCFGLLQTYRELQAELARTREASLVPAPSPSWIRRWAWVPAAAAVVVAASLALWRPVPEPPPSTDAGEAPAASATSDPTPQPAPPAARPSLADLARVEPPRYAPGRLRGVEDEATARYQEAMTRYQQRDYAAATAGLSAAARLDPEAPHIAFFLGVSHLMMDRPEAAVEALRRTIALGDSPYTEEARFFLAKAHLQTGDIDAAKRELASTVQLRGDREAEARAILRQLERLAVQAK